MPKKEHKTLLDEAISLNEELEDRLANSIDECEKLKSRVDELHSYNSILERQEQDLENELAYLKANAIEEPKKPSKATVEGALKFLNKKGYRVTLSSPPAKQY